MYAKIKLSLDIHIFLLESWMAQEFSCAALYIMYKTYIELINWKKIVEFKSSCRNWKHTSSNYYWTTVL